MNTPEDGNAAALRFAIATALACIDPEAGDFAADLERLVSAARPVLADARAETAEACRVAVAALYTEESYPPPRGTHMDGDELGDYDSGVADAEIVIASIRDAARAAVGGAA